MSALPPKADITEDRRHVRFVPKAELEYLTSALRRAALHLCEYTATANALARSCGVGLCRPAQGQVRSGRARLLRAAGQALDWPVRD
jgi:hypothetical protein